MNGLKDALVCGAECRFAELSTQKVLVANQNMIVVPKVFRAHFLVKENRGQQEADGLFSSVQRAFRALDNGWPGHGGAPGFVTHATVIVIGWIVETAHGQFAEGVGAQKGVELGQQVAAHKRVLHKSNNDGVALWIQDLIWNREKFLGLGDGFVALQTMHIHLVSVKVGIERLRHRQRQPEAQGIGAINGKGHHTGFPKTGLAIEDDPVPVLEMAFDNVAEFQLGCKIKTRIEIQNRKPDQRRALLDRHGSIFLVRSDGDGLG